MMDEATTMVKRCKINLKSPLQNRYAISAVLLAVFVKSTTHAFHVQFTVPVRSSSKLLVSSSSAPSSSSVVSDESTNDSCTSAAKHVLDSISKTGRVEGQKWAEMFGFEGCPEQSFFSLFHGIREGDRDVPLLGLGGSPFYLDAASLEEDGKRFQNFFTFDDLAVALKEDFLDADRGSTDNKKGWKVSRVSTPRDSSFEGARMNLEQVNQGLEKGTVIFNAIGAHIPKLAGATLACCDATSLPNAVNMYVTAANQRTSAPPHTDKQDVVVVQSTGSKHWKVYSPPTHSFKPSSDPFSRGKGDDNLPLFALQDFGCSLLLDVVLHPGDCLFIPAGFPHTTDTVTEDDDGSTSIHLTFNFDTHVWDLDYLSLRRLALRRAGVDDTKLGQTRDEDNRYVGNVNMLSNELHTEIFKQIPLGILEDDDVGEGLVDEVVSNLAKLSYEVDQMTAIEAEKSSATIWKDTVSRVREQGMELYDIHRDMYLAAKDEGDLRKSEAAMKAHLDDTSMPMTPERMQRLSLFRVQRYFEKIAASKESLNTWSLEGNRSGAGALPSDWAFSLPVKVGDKVEANFGGAWFPATVSKIIGSTYNVEFFDGDSETGLERSALKLLTPPLVDDGSKIVNGVDTSSMTKKELKKFLRKQEKKNKK